MEEVFSWFWFPHRVTYQETDAMGVVYHANYLHWFEIGRTEYIRSKGLSYRVLEEKGLFLPVRDVRCRYFKPARYDDVIAIGTRVEKVSRASVTFCYEIRNEEKSLVLVKGFTQLAAVDKNTRPISFSEEIKKYLSVD